MSKFKSGLEHRFHTHLKDLEYEVTKVPYVSKHTYTPDFKLAENLFVETKGLFTSADRTKHLLVRDQNPQVKILFVFQNPFQTLSKKSKTTYADWCEANQFKWLHIDQVKDHTPASLIDILQGGIYNRMTNPKKHRNFWEKK